MFRPQLSLHPAPQSNIESHALFRSGTRSGEDDTPLHAISPSRSRYQSRDRGHAARMAVHFNTPAPRPVPGPAPRRGPRGAALGEVLLERRVITAEQLQIAIEHQRTTNRRIGQLLIDLGFTTADAVLGDLTLQLGVPSMRLHGHRVSASALQAMPEKLARKHHAMPLQKS
jgi:Type II secretion system (T2SS), protein E, N-terminal domain